MTFIIIFGIITFSFVFIPVIIDSIKARRMRKRISRQPRHDSETQGYSATDMTQSGLDRSLGSSSSDSYGSDSGGYDSGGYS